ncbi:MAG: efflux RND transporter periplasmic adaptor subunit, partial [Planctomycetota bacterium]
MSEENTRSESESGVGESRTLTKAESRKLLWNRFAWWFKLFAQPLIAVAAIVLLVVAFGAVQRMGWINAGDSESVAEATPGEEVLYICPMVCVAPASAPGKCPVCGMDLKAQKPSGDAKDRYGMTIDPASIRVANIQTTIAESVPLVREIRAIGEISYDEGSLATISAYVDGRIDSLFADYTGVNVRQGDELALLYSPELYTSQNAMIESLRFAGDNRSSNEQVNRRNREFYESARQRLIELGMTEEQVSRVEQTGEADSRIRIVSPITGTVIEKMVEHGEYVQTGTSMFRVADLSSVWLMLELFPRDAANIRFGQLAPDIGSGL